MRPGYLNINLSKQKCRGRAVNLLERLHTEPPAPCCEKFQFLRNSITLPVKCAYRKPLISWRK